MVSQREHRSKIQALHAAGVSHVKISRQLGVNRNTVINWSKKEDGDVIDSERSGRPSKVTPKTKKRITALMRNRVAGVRPTAKILNHSPMFAETGKTVGPSTVRRFVKSTEWGNIA